MQPEPLKRASAGFGAEKGDFRPRCIPNAHPAWAGCAFVFAAGKILFCSLLGNPAVMLCATSRLNIAGCLFGTAERSIFPGGSNERSTHAFERGRVDCAFVPTVVTTSPTNNRLPPGAVHQDKARQGRGISQVD